MNRGPSSERDRDTAGRFKKGHSLAGPGRPKGSKSLRTLVRENGDLIVEDDPRKRTLAELLVDRLWMQAIGGSERAIQMIIDIVDGPYRPSEPPPRPVEVYSVSFEDGSPINRRNRQLEQERKEEPTQAQGRREQTS